jgi:O-glycosyl hydrolase
LLSAYVREYKSRFDIDIRAVSFQNEPSLNTDYQSCVWPSEQMRNFVIFNLGPTSERDQVQAKIVMSESNTFETMPGEAEATMADPQARKL